MKKAILGHVLTHIDYLIKKYEESALAAKSVDVYSTSKHIVFDLQQIKENIKKEFEEKESV